MVCIAAFIILALVGVIVAFISIFKREVGIAYWKAFKKAWGCVWKKVRLQKCETNFKDDVKNTLLKKIILKKPKLIKPLSIVIEVVSVLIVVVVVWAILTSIKSLLALWALGTCNVDTPSACSLSSEACSLGDDNESKTTLEKFGRWFTEWGDIFAAVPDAVKSWNAEEYLTNPYLLVGKDSVEEGKPYAVDILDPGCSACLQSYKNQLSSGFFDNHNTVILLYPIKISETEYKFPNSYLAASIIYATKFLETKNTYGEKILEKIFTEKDESGVLYQNTLNTAEPKEVETLLKSWLKSFSATDAEIEKIFTLKDSDEVKNLLDAVRDIAENKVHIKGIPTLIYDGRKHLGRHEIK